MRSGQPKNLFSVVVLTLMQLIRRKKGQDSDKIKEELRRKEQLKEVEKRKQEKIDDAVAKERVRQQIKETQELRKQQAEREKAQREGRVLEERPEPAKPPVSRISALHTETRLQLRLPSGPPFIKTFPADTTLFEVADAVKAERGIFPYAYIGTTRQILTHYCRHGSYIDYHDIPSQGVSARYRLWSNS